MTHPTDDDLIRRGDALMACGMVSRNDEAAFVENLLKSLPAASQPADPATNAICRQQVKVHGREMAYQAYINEMTPNGNSRMDNITICAGPNENHQRHIATQVDMAFQAGWRAAIAAWKGE